MKTDVSLPNSSGPPPMIHATACVDQPCQIGAGTKIWHYSHIMPGAVLGTSCNIGQNVFIASGVQLGNNVKVQNNVSLYEGCILEDDVFCGPSAVFTNVRTPRSAIVRKGQYGQTYVERGATIGANSTLVAPIRIGHDATHFGRRGRHEGRRTVRSDDGSSGAARRLGRTSRSSACAVPGGRRRYLDLSGKRGRYRQLDADRLEPDRAEQFQSAS